MQILCVNKNVLFTGLSYFLLSCFSLYCHDCSCSVILFMLILVIFRSLPSFILLCILSETQECIIYKNVKTGSASLTTRDGHC